MQNRERFQLKWGRGFKRDYTGERECSKRYLLNSGNDTILTLRMYPHRLEFLDSIVYYRRHTPKGWHWVNEKNALVAEQQFFWNETVYVMDFHYYMSGWKKEAFRKVQLLELIPLAQDRSAVGSDEWGNFWFIMWVIELAN